MLTPTSATCTVRGNIACGSTKTGTSLSLRSRSTGPSLSSRRRAATPRRTSRSSTRTTFVSRILPFEFYTSAVDPLVDFKWWLTDEEEEEDINYYNNKRGIQVGNREDGPVLNQNRQSASGRNQTRRRRRRQPSLREGYRNSTSENPRTSSQDKFNNRLILDDGDMHTAAELCASESSRAARSRLCQRRRGSLLPNV